MPDKVKILYDAVSKDYNVGSFEEFQTKLQDDTKRKAFYDGVSSEFDLGDFNTFSSKVKKKDISQPVAPTGSQTLLPGSKPFQTQVDTKIPSVLTEKGKVSYGEEIKKKAKQKQKLSEQLNIAKSAFAAAQGEDVARDIEMYQQDPESFRQIEAGSWLGNAIKQGLLTGELANSLPVGGAPSTPEDLSRIADINYQIERIPQSEAQKEYQKSGLGVFKNPLLGAQFLTETLASSFAGLYESAKRTVPLATSAGAGIGAFAGGVGALPGAGLGAMGGLSVAGLNLSTSADIMQSLRDSGVDVTNKDSLIKAFSDKNKMSEIRTNALKYGVPIMVVDMAAAGIAGKLIGGTAGKSIAKKIGAGLGEAGIQAVGGSTGELSGQYLSGKKINWNDVAIEGMASLATDAPDIAIGAITRDKASSSNKNIVSQINKFGVENGAVDAKINLDRDLVNGTITQDEYQQGVQFIEKAILANEKIPIEIEGENREKSIELIAKKDDILLDIEELNKQKEGVDDSFYPAIDEQIKSKEEEVKSINETIQQLAKTPTAQPTEEVIELDNKKSQEDLANQLNKEAGIDVFVARQPIKINNQDFVISQIKENNNDNTFIIEDASGNEIGRAQFNPDSNYIENIRIDNKYRRQGIALKVYDFIESRKNVELQPSPIKQSKEAKALWDKRNKLKQQEDAIQVETASKVPVQPKATVSEEVEGGKPEAETEVVTEEGKEEVAPAIESIANLELNENNLDSTIEVLDFIEEAKRKASRPNVSKKTKAKLTQDIANYEAELSDSQNEVKVVKVINDNFDSIKKDLKDKGLLKVNCK